MEWLLLLVPVVVIAIVVAAAIAAHQAEKSRTERLAAAAAQMGFSFQADGQAILTSGITQLPLFNRGRSRKARNVMQKTVRGTEIILLDYQYTVGGGKHSRTYRHTLALFHPEGVRRLPDFEMSPEHLLHKLGALFGYQDLDFATHPGFSHRYLVRGADEQAVRAALNEAVLDSFEKQKESWWVATRGGWLVAYKNSRARPEQLRDFLRDASKILVLLVPDSTVRQDQHVSQPDSEADALGQAGFQPP